MKRAFLKTLYFIYIRLIGIIKPISFGVRIMLFRDGEVLLVKHSYQDEWFFPGGGLKRHETLAEAAHREVWEEVGGKINDLKFFGIYTNSIHLRTDHIAVFIARDFSYSPHKDWEIEAVQFFPLDALPATIAPGIGRRIEDYRTGKKDNFGRW